jgi:hypothetical protein
MKRFVMAVALSCALFATALAGDVPSTDKPSPAPADIPTCGSPSPGDIPTTDVPAPGEIPSTDLSVVLMILALAF